MIFALLTHCRSFVLILNCNCTCNTSAVWVSSWRFCGIGASGGVLLTHCRSFVLILNCNCTCNTSVVWVSSWRFCGIGASGGVYCWRMFYNQPNCCKGLKVCMNGRIFLVGVAMNRAKTVGKKVAGSKHKRAPWSKKWGGGSGPSAQ